MRVAARLPNKEMLILLALGLPVALAVGLITPTLPPQAYALLTAGTIALILRRPDLWLVGAVLFAVPSGLIRRIFAGDAARIDFDPLVAIPLGMAVLALVMLPFGATTSIVVRPLSLIATGLIGSMVAATVITSRFGTADLYVLAAQAVPLAVFVAVNTGLMPNVWPILERCLPWLGVAASGYGIYQFSVLPDWDRRWMIASGLDSIGQPQPQLVRVFSWSEAPGPFAVFIGLALLVTFVRASRSHAMLRMLWGVTLVPMGLALILSGVRSVLVALVVVLAVFLLRGSKISTKILITVLLFGGWYAVGWAVSNFGQGSMILTAERFDLGSLATDVSVRERLNLLPRVSSGLSSPFGNRLSIRADSYLIDLLLTYGAVPAALGAAFLLGVLIRGIRLLGVPGYTTSAMGAIYFVMILQAGALTVSTVGILIGIVFAAACMPHHRGVAGITGQSDPT